MSSSQENSAFPSSEATMYRCLVADLEEARPFLGRMQNNFEATAARRKLLELVVQLSAEYGHEVRHGDR